VIPTRYRAHLVKRAVQSALGQTLKEIEVIVVIDGPDQSTREVLSEIDDPRLQVIELSVSEGASEARNVGVSSATAKWIAFLDDDDEWLLHKLEMQFASASCSHHAFPIIACRLIARTPKGEFIWPRRLLALSEPLSEYLLARNTLFRGEGLIQTSMLLAKKDLLQKVPFRKDLQRHQDWDWLLRISTLDGVVINFVPQPLAMWYVEEKRTSISSKNNWQYSLAWIQELRSLVTPRAYAAFVLVQVSADARQQEDWNAFLPLFLEAVRFGKPKLIDFLLFMGMWIVPRGNRRWLRAVLTKEPRGLRSA